MQGTDPEVAKSFRIAIAQIPISGNIHRNSIRVQNNMRRAARSGARLIQFPEGMLSGYAKHPIQDWAEVDWGLLRQELKAIMALAAQLKLWVCLGSAHQLTSPHWPHNSLYIISDEGKLVNRYDKRIVSHTEVTRFYTPGAEPVVFDAGGFRFGCIICVEINFPDLFAEYEKLGVDCLLLSAYPEARVFYTKACAHAAIQCYWISLSVPTECSDMMRSSLIDPNGEPIAVVDSDESLLIANMNPRDPVYDIALTKARPWRASVATDKAYRPRAANDPRSVNRTVL